MATSAHAGYCPACFYLLRTAALTTQTPEAWDRFERYLDTPRDEIVMEVFEQWDPEQIQQIRDTVTEVIAYREGRK